MMKWMPKCNKSYYFADYEQGERKFIPCEEIYQEMDNGTFDFEVFRTLDECQKFCDELNKAVEKVQKNFMSANESIDTADTFKRRWVGYQVKTKDDEFVAPYSDKDVFRHIEDAENFIRSKRNGLIMDGGVTDNLVIESRWLENEDEEIRYFDFHGCKHRTFEQGEKVYDTEQNQWVHVLYDSFVSLEEQEVRVVADGHSYVAKANSLYQLADNKVCPRCGEPLCTEHVDHIDYPYFCPACEENFMNIEL